MSIQDEPHSARKLQATWQHQTSQAGRGRTSVCHTKPGIWILGVAELEVNMVTSRSTGPFRIMRDSIKRVLALADMGLG